MIINNLRKPSRSFVFALMMGAGVSSIPLPVGATVSVQNVQQTGQVKGIVVDANGEPIIGATIQVKDAKNGTVTDLDGHFVMANAIGKTLTVSYIGYKKVEVVAKSATLRITLESEIAALDEVVVIGYGTQRKGDVTSSVGSVKSEDFTANPEKAVVTGDILLRNSCYDYGRRDNVLATHDNADIKFGRMLDELGWEFSQEGRRRQDMIRFGVFTTRSWFSHDASDETRNLFPIPNSQILTNGNLKQNPGY